MSVLFNDALRNLIVDAMVTAFDGGVIEIYTGAQPGDVADDATGDLLATIELPSPAFTEADAGIAELVGIWSATAVASGTAGWARFRNADDTIRMDMAIDSEELSLDVVDIVEGEDVTISAFSINQPV